MRSYAAYRYLWPPRPEHLIQPGMLRYYERLGWISQVKKNGTCIVVFSRGSELILMTRHATAPKAYQVAPALRAGLTGISDGWTVLVGELLHHKSPHIKDTVYLFDLLVDNGQHLTGVSLADRLDRLQVLFPRRADCLSTGAYQASERVWVARTYRKGFDKLFNGLQATEDEGLVLKDPTAGLGFGLNPHEAKADMVKCRR